MGYRFCPLIQEEKRLLRHLNQWRFPDCTNHLQRSQDRRYRRSPVLYVPLIAQHSVFDKYLDYERLKHQ